MKNTERSIYYSHVVKGRLIRHTPPRRYRAHLRWVQHQLNSRIDPLLSDAVHGWRRGRSVDTAVRSITAMGGVCAGVDIVRFFYNIDQRRMLRLVRQHVADGDRICSLIEPWLPDEGGLPDGVSFSPVLANLYLDSFDRRFRCVRYADNVAFVTPAREIDKEVAAYERQLGDIGLRLHHHEFEEVNFCKRQLVSLPGGQIGARSGL